MKQNILNVFVIFSILILFSGFAFLYYQIRNIPKDASVELRPQESLLQNIQEEKTMEEVVGENYITEEEVDEKISQALSTISGETKTIIREVTPRLSKKITYISLGDAYSTTSTGWVDVPGSAVYINVEVDYGSGAKVSWEASIKIAHPNGKVFARLYDDTNKIAVDYSEIASEENNYEQVSSGYLPFWKGRNLYKVQIKSLNSFEAFYTGGKIKIAY